MASLNKTRVRKTSKTAARKTTRKAKPVTHEGAAAAKTTAEEQLRRTVMACLLWENTFYESGVSVATRIRKLVEDLDLQTVSKIAIEARSKMHLRHVPLLLVREMARKGGEANASLIGYTLSEVIQRPDELTEFLNIYWLDGKDQALSAQVKKGLAAALTKFDEYQLAKYNRTKKDVTLRDVIFLTHPTPRDKKQQKLWDKVVEDKLETPDTWETELSAGKDKGATFTRLIKEGKLGGLAILRNLRNMTEANVTDATIRKALKDGNFSRVLPFRYISAAKYAPKYEAELEKAMFKSLEGTPKLPGKTVLVLDNSGSMYGVPVSAKSDIERVDAAAGVAMLLREICEDCVVISFANSPKVLPNRRGFALAEAYRKSPSGGTNTQNAKKAADAEGYDRIIIVTDEQSHQSITAPKKGTKGYVINVAQYQNGIGYGSWTHIDGWSESVVRYIQASEGLASESTED